ncbi:hypothetical protein AFFFEF_01335 [Methylorubrum extorquens]
MFAAPEGDDRPQHGEPQEQDRGEFVGPNQGPVQGVAADDAAQEHDDLQDDEDRRGDLDHPPEDAIEGLEIRALAGGGHGGGRRGRVELHVELHGGLPHTSFPVTLSRWSQAVDPSLAFQSR